MRRSGGVRTGAAVAALAAAGGLLAACGGGHAAAAPSVVVSRPNTPAADGYAYDGKPVTIQMALRGDFTENEPVSTKADKNGVYSVGSGYATLVGSPVDGCNPLPKPVPAKTVQAVMARHGIVDVAFRFLPKVAQESLTWATDKGPEGKTAHGYPKYSIFFLLRGVRVGSATAKTERYRIGPDEPGLLVDQVTLDDRGNGWAVIPQQTFQDVVSLARC